MDHLYGLTPDGYDMVVVDDSLWYQQCRYTEWLDGCAFEAQCSPAAEGLILKILVEGKVEPPGKRRTAIVAALALMTPVEVVLRGVVIGPKQAGNPYGLKELEVYFCAATHEGQPVAIDGLPWLETYAVSPLWSVDDARWMKANPPASIVEGRLQRGQIVSGVEQPERRYRIEFDWIR
jgi:hypothetical protein